jgi:hypothetical protein
MHLARVLGYDTIQPGRNVLAFMRNLLTVFVLLGQILSNISEFYWAKCCIPENYPS